MPSLVLPAWRRQARAKERNAAVALERLLEERFSEPDALGQGAAQLVPVVERCGGWQPVGSRCVGVSQVIGDN